MTGLWLPSLVTAGWAVGGEEVAAAAARLLEAVRPGKSSPRGISLAPWEAASCGSKKGGRRGCARSERGCRAVRGKRGGARLASGSRGALPVGLQQSRKVLLLRAEATTATADGRSSGSLAGLQGTAAVPLPALP